VALAVSFFSTFCTGFTLAYICSWRLALAMTSIIPCMMLVAIIMNIFVSKHTTYVFLPNSSHWFFKKKNRTSLKHTAEGGGLAELVISTVHTAKTFGIRSTLQGLYSKFMDRALVVNLKSAYWQGVSCSFSLSYMLHMDLVSLFFFFLFFPWNHLFTAFGFGTTL
jgi:ATP-binding cassette subfamily B (MDR/TAP) protein 1